MLVSALLGSALSGAAAFLVVLSSALIGGAATIGTLLEVTTEALFYTFVCFLLAFGAAVLVMLPLHLGLEKIGLRKLWPYLVAAFAVESLIAAIVTGRPLPLSPESVWFFAPGLAMAILFWRRIDRARRAAERAAPPALRVLH